MSLSLPERLARKVAWPLVSRDILLEHVETRIADAIREALEEAAKAVEDEAVEGALDANGVIVTGDVAYNLAIEHAAGAIRALKDAP